MGLTESNHSKATTGCTGPSKSRSTPHFPDSRGYQNRPRQAATLPARPTPDSSQTPPYHHPRTPVRDPQPIGHDPRPPETERSYRDGFVQVGRSPSFRPVAPRRSASADSRKRRSDPLLDAKTFKQLPEMVSFQQQPAHVSLSHSRVSPPTSPRSNPQRPRPTAIYVADDQPTRLVKTREGRSRDRGSNGSKSRNPPKAETRDRSRGSRERRQRTTHVSTFTMTPHCPENSPLPASHETQPVSHQRHKKTRHRSGQRAEFTAPDNPQGDPYVCLHYGGTMRNGQRKPIQQVTAWRTEQEEEEPPSPNRQMSQVVIHMNQVTATTLDNYDALNANIESVQVRRNVWFQASRAIGSASEPPMVRKISSKAMRTPSICETTSGYDNSEIIRWPDVTNKVSSIYMRPEMNFADVSRSAREQEGVCNNGDSSSVCQGSNRISVGSCDHRCAVNRSAKDNTVASMYQVSYSKRTENKGVYFSDSAEEQYVHDSDWDYCRNREKNAKSFASTSEIRKKRGVEMPSQDEILPPLEFSEGSCMQSSTNGDVYHSSFVSEEEQERGRDDHVNKKKMELNFGINNHVEDYTIIEDATNEARFYGCRDSDQENDESPSFAACDSLLSGIGQPSSLTNKDMPVECSDTLDNISLVNDKADKEPATDDGKIPFVDNSLFALRVSEQLPESFIVQGNGTSIKTYDDAPLSKTWNERDLDNFYKEQISLVTDYLSLRDPCLCKGKEEKSDIYEKVVDHPGGSYPAATVPGSPSALAFSQKCLTQSSSLPRHLQCVSRSAATDSGNIDNMKAFRNRFRSFDLGRFPVLRLPLGNQPRLIDVLRVNPSGSQEQKSNVSQGKVNDESSDTSDNAILHIAEDDVNDEVDGASSSVVRDPLVSYMDCYSPQESGQKDEAVDPGEISPVPCDIGALSINSSGNDRIRTQSCPEAQRLPNDHDSQDEECLSDEGCDVGTIMRGAIPDLNGANTYVVPCDVPLSLHTNPTLHDHGDRSESGNDGTGVRSGDHGEENEVITGSRNTWQAEEDNGHVRSHRWSNGMVEDGARLSPDGVTLRHPEKEAVLLRSDKRRAVSDGTHPLRSSSHRNPPCVVPDIIPPFNKHARRKPPTNRTSLHSIDWDTPLPPPVVLNIEEPDCSYTCHEQCQDLVTLDCKTDLTPDSHTSEEDLYVDTDQGTLVKHEHLSNQNLSITVTSQEEESEEEEDYQEEQEEKHEEEQQEKELLEEPYRWNEEVSTLRKSVNRLQSHLVDNETLEAWVEKYNATSQGLQIAKENDGSYRGCIRVHLNLSRPINIVAGTRPPSIYDILQEDRTMEKTLTSFYMPRDAVKAIHITSKTTTREVIIALLRKFKVVDNPQKFALYERTYDTGQPGKAKLRRLGDSECPLVLAINWSAGGLTNKRLVLQENDTADIQWEAFSLPELSNFLRILDREEEEYRCQIKDKYALLRRRIGNMLIQTSSVE